MLTPAAWFHVVRGRSLAPRRHGFNRITGGDSSTLACRVGLRHHHCGRAVFARFKVGTVMPPGQCPQLAGRRALAVCASVDRERAERSVLAPPAARWRQLASDRCTWRSVSVVRRAVRARRTQPPPPFCEVERAELLPAAAFSRAAVSKHVWLRAPLFFSLRLHRPLGQLECASAYAT